MVIFYNILLLNYKILNLYSFGDDIYKRKADHTFIPIIITIQKECPDIVIYLHWVH